MRDTVAEMAERAQLISQEAGSKVAAAMKDVIGAAAGLTGFAIESARDLVSYMVRRGQMTPEEGDKLIREAEASHDKRPASEKNKPTASKIAAEKAAAAKIEAAARAAAQMAAMTPFRHPTPARPVAPPVVEKPTKPAVVVPSKPVAKAAPAQPVPAPKAAPKLVKPAKVAASARPSPAKTAKAKPANASKPAAKKKPKR